MGPVFGNSYMSRSDTSVLVITPRFCEFLWTPKQSVFSILPFTAVSGNIECIIVHAYAVLWGK